MRAVKRDRHKRAFKHILRACNYAHRLVLTNIYRAYLKMVGVFVLAQAKYLANNNVCYAVHLA